MAITLRSDTQLASSAMTRPAASQRNLPELSYCEFYNFPRAIDPINQARSPSESTES